MKPLSLEGWDGGCLTSGDLLLVYGTSPHLNPRQSWVLFLSQWNPSLQKRSYVLSKQVCFYAYCKLPPTPKPRILSIVSQSIDTILMLITNPSSQALVLSSASLPIEPILMEKVSGALLKRYTLPGTFHAVRLKLSCDNCREETSPRVLLCLNFALDSRSLNQPG